MPVLLARQARMPVLLVKTIYHLVPTIYYNAPVSYHAKIQTIGGLWQWFALNVVRK